MEKIKSTLPNIMLSLTSICLIAGVALSAANKYTASAITASKALSLENAIRHVTPAFDNNPVEEQYKMAVTQDDSLTFYPAKRSGKYVGCAVESYTKNGFCGLIRVMAGFDADNNLYNYSVLEHNETPGLGTRMNTWFREDKNRQNIIGRDMSKALLRVTKDGGDVDAITAATITSRAFLEAINRAYSTYYGDETDTESGATRRVVNGASDNDSDSNANVEGNGQDFRQQRKRQRQHGN